MTDTTPLKNRQRFLVFGSDRWCASRPQRFPYFRCIINGPYHHCSVDRINSVERSTTSSQVVRQQAYGLPCDMWGVGVCLYTLLTGIQASYPANSCEMCGLPFW
jgi:hypothetical protein